LRSRESRRETRTIKTLRAMQERTTAKLNGQGWELIDEKPAPLLRTELTFSREKPKQPIWPWLTLGSIIAVCVVTLAVMQLIGYGDTPVRANDAASSNDGVHTHSTSVPSATTTNSTPLASTNWMTQLDSLTIKPALALTNYQRTTDFGPAWADVDGQPCDTRDQILKRDLIDITLSGECKVASGTLHDPYTGKIIHFVRGEQTSMAVQIDHVVPLANSWVEGAQSLSFAQREQMANDPVELWAVDGPTNESKGDGDASVWLPADTASDCAYVEKQVLVKVKYRLWVTQAEHDAIARVLSGCGEPTASAAPSASPSPSVTAAPAPQPAPVPAPAPPASSVAQGIHPGSYCSIKGQVGVSAEGRTYVCGSKGADSRGHFHWNS
jgi:hypothetical protein